MATLAEIFGTVPEGCYVDDNGVYLNGKKIALDNARNSAYIRYDGEVQATKISYGVYEITHPYVLVACAPNANPQNLLDACISATVNGHVTIIEATIDKSIIGERENITDLRKFDGVAMAWVRYDHTYKADLPATVTPYEQCWVLDTGFWDGSCLWTADGLWNA